ncbi:MAG: N-acyl homoserine lactonase family protein [Dehalococcoidia bacterium]|nr:N-acyl homoserine lactonase family protein [Dehalococcoidia bacterium]
MNYKIRCLLTGTVTTDSSVEKMHSVLDAGRKIRVPVNIFYVEGPKLRLIFEAGMASSEEMNKKWGAGKHGALPPAEGGGAESIEKSLAEVGATTDDIQFVIPSHLHTDHAWNLDVFPRAKVIAQREEIIEAIDPPSPMRFGYSRIINTKLVSRRQPDELKIIDGDCDIAEGLKLIKVPGHTPGSQTLIVQTEKGKVALCGQTGPSYANWFPADARLGHALGFLKDTYNPDPLLAGTQRTYIQSMERIAGMADIVVPTHDWRIPRRIPEQWWFSPPDEVCSRDWSKVVFKYGLI